MNAKIFFFALTLALSACSASRLTPEQKAQKEAEMAHNVHQQLQERHFDIEVDYMLPLGHGARRLSYGYDLAVRGDSIISYLPYFGRAYQLPYGGGKGLNFTAKINRYVLEKGKKGLMRVTIDTRNEEDVYTYSLEVYPSGKCAVHVQSQNKRPIDFSGTMKMEGGEP